LRINYKYETEKVEAKNKLLSSESNLKNEALIQKEMLENKLLLEGYLRSWER